MANAKRDNSSNFVSSTPQQVLVRVLCLAICIGVLTGLIEGCGLLIFQHLNQETWALRVSSPIIWISPVVDVLFFCLLGFLVVAVSSLYRRMDAFRATFVLISSLAVYDLVTLTARFSSRSRVLLTIGVGFAIHRWILRHDGAVWKFCKRSLPWAVAAGVLVFIGIQAGRSLEESRAIAELPAPAPNSPNVLLIVIDTLRADHLSAYGYNHQTSPNIDALARDGALFENAISACSWTYPSHVSLVTGRPQFEHGRTTLALSPLFHADENIFGGYPTIGDVLQQHGYRTGAFSANRSFFVGNLGFNRGFIHFDDYFNSIPDMFSRTLVGKELLRLYGKAFKRGVSNRMLSYGPHNGFRKQPADVNQELLHWIDKGGSHPFFAFLNYYSVHEPYGAPGSPRTEPKGTLSDADLYDQGVKYTDHYIGLLMQALKERGLDKNTLVIVTSDHGESLGEHDFAGHGRLLYFEQIHVPLVFWYPGHLPSSTRVPQPVSNVKIAATIMDLIGSHSREFPGPALDWAWQPARNVIWPDPISELAQDNRIFKDDLALDKRLATAQTGAMKSLVTSQWHLIVHKTFGEQLYDWRHDPTETKNLITTAEGQQIAGRLLADLASELNKGDLDGEHSSPTIQTASTQSTSTKSSQSWSIAKVDNQYYRVQAKSGEKLNISVEATNPKGQFDPVITIENASGEMYQSCRNLRDDNIPAPGVSDPTPQDFDDMCIDGGVEPQGTINSGLEILVPGNPGSSTELKVRIDDWNGHRITNTDYSITVVPKAE